MKIKIIKDTILFTTENIKHTEKNLKNSVNSVRSVVEISTIIPP